MLRVGLTGGLGSGKTRVAAFFCECGARVLEADAIARELMQPGRAVYELIVERFGVAVVRSDGTLDRTRLAELAFREGYLADLNRIVHPPTIAEQERRMREIFAQDPRAVVLVESALIFEAEAGGSAPGWRHRFDRLILVVAPDELKIQRFLARILPPDATAEQRTQAARDARARLAAQIPDREKAPLCDYVINNAGTLDETQAQVERISRELRAASEIFLPSSIQ